jgi:hypothetical protein
MTAARRGENQLSLHGVCVIPNSIGDFGRFIDVTVKSVIISHYKVNCNEKASISVSACGLGCRIVPRRKGSGASISGTLAGRDDSRGICASIGGSPRSQAQCWG